MKQYYQPKSVKKGKYALRENTYRRIWYLIADYPYFKELQATDGEQESLGAAAPSNSSMLRESSLLGYKVQGTSFQYREYIAAIEAAKQEIPTAYVDAVMSHIIDKKKYKDMEGISETTMKRWVQRFIWHVANKLGDV